MARNDESQRNPNAPSRVYKRSDVHKRRVNSKGRDKKTALGPGAEAASEPKREEQPPVAPPKEAVVIAPEFGGRTEARRQADDRWFAAMREREEAAFDSPASPGDGAQAASGIQSDGQGSRESENGLNQATSSAPPSETPAAVEKEASVKPGVSDQLAAEGELLADGRMTGEGVPTPDGPLPAEEPPASAEDAKSRRATVRKPLSRKARIALIVGSVVLVAAIVAVAVFAWNRWYRFDDHGDMQGTWYVVGTTVPVTIDESAIHLTTDVTYQYEINAHDKTIRYTFGPMEGQGRYWFSDDRQYLVITDGEDYTSTSTAVDDLLHMFSDMGDKVTGAPAKLPEGEGIIAFSREPDAKALERQKQEAASKAAADAAARQEADRAAAAAAAAAAAEAAAWEEYVEEPPVEQPPAEQAPAEEAPPAEGPENQPAEQAQPEEN